MGQFLDRSGLLEELSDAIRKNNHVSIIGAGGSGKTTLITQYLQNAKERGHKNVSYIYGYDLEFGNKKLELFRNLVVDKREALIVIDEFETIQSPKLLDQVKRFLKEGRKHKSKVVVLSRVTLENEFAYNTHTINLNNRKISKSEIQNLIKEYFKDDELSKEKIKNIEAVLIKLESSPLAINMALGLLKNGDYSASDISAVLKEKLTYQNVLIEQFSNRNEIFIPEAPKIITDLITINQSLLEKVKRNPKSIYEITPRQFEELVAELFERDGYNVKITPQTQDGGKDLIILENKLLGNFLCYVECKRYHPENPVGVRVVRELFGTITADRATAGVIVTSSYFSEPAQAFTEKVKHQMNLIDYANLTSIINGVSDNSR